MTVGNVLGLVQVNIKRLLAYSSIAHSGYMLVAVAALVTSGSASGALLWQQYALRGILFYLAAYGLTNIAAFGVLSLLPGREETPGSSAETFDEIAGLGRNHVGLGLAMAIACFSLVGIPLTVGFVGKVLLIQPALQAGLYTLVAILVINSAISAGYYLRIIATLFLKPRTIAPGTIEPATPRNWPLPTTFAICASVAAILLLGCAIPLVNYAVYRVQMAGQLDLPTTSAKPISNFVSVEP
jgi:NADH-quinone oxidoreductase subunit N